MNTSKLPTTRANSKAAQVNRPEAGTADHAGGFSDAHSGLCFTPTSALIGAVCGLTEQQAERLLALAIDLSEEDSFRRFSRT